MDQKLELTQLGDYKYTRNWGVLGLQEMPLLRKMGEEIGKKKMVTLVLGISDYHTKLYDFAAG